MFATAIFTLGSPFQPLINAFLVQHEIDLEAMECRCNYSCIGIFVD